VALKIEPEEMADCVAPALRELLGIPVSKQILNSWIEKHAESLPLEICDRRQTSERSAPLGSPNDSGLVDISVRRAVILVLKCVASLLGNCHSPSSSGMALSKACVCMYASTVEPPNKGPGISSFIERLPSLRRLQMYWYNRKVNVWDLKVYRVCPLFGVRFYCIYLLLRLRLCRYPPSLLC
jgi:hypothetical protein